MLLQQFILQDGHFALSIFVSLVFFAVSWLYFDAYFASKNKKDLLKIIGFWFLSFSFLINSTRIEQTILLDPIASTSLVEILTNLTKLLGYGFLALGLLTDSVQKKPVYSSTGQMPSASSGQAPSAASNAATAAPSKSGQVEQQAHTVSQEKPQVLGIFLMQSLPNILLNFSFPLLSLSVFILFLRRTTVGLERHLKSLTIGFFFLFLYELFSLSRLFENTTSVFIYKITSSFGPLWILEQILLLISVTVIAKWIFGYLLKRIQTQLFMIINISVLVVFLVTTVSFTGLLLTSFRKDALTQLMTDVSVAKYAISSKQEQRMSDAEVVSQNPALISAVLARDKNALKDLSTSFLLAKNQSNLIILSVKGEVLMRGEDNEKTGDFLSSDPLFVRAARGEKASSVVSRDGPIAPIVSIRSSVPIVSGADTIGVVIVGENIDNAFVDGLKESTKLDVSVYGGNSLSATTFVAEDGKSRFVGVKEENKDVNQNVLIEGKNYSLDINISNNSYLASFAPLSDADGNPVGMLFVGKPQVSVIQAASRAIEYTFIITAILILISVFPSYFISKYIANQFK